MSYFNTLCGRYKVIFTGLCMREVKPSARIVSLLPIREELITSNVYCEQCGDVNSEQEFKNGIFV